jgi:2'-5' RNA ligase
MRLFAALDPPPDTAHALRRAVDRGRGHTPGLRWADPDEWHLTLVFLGEVDGALLPALGDALGREARGHRPFHITAEGWGAFPGDLRRASVLWAGLGGDTASLHALADGLRAAAAEVGVPVENRPYVPHVTVARSRPARDLTGTADALGALPGRRWPVREVRLVESRPEREDRYRTVRTWRLGWEADPTRPPERSTS